MPDVSIAVSLKDRYSDGIKSMQNANRAFDKSLDEINEAIKQNDQRKRGDRDNQQDQLERNIDSHHLQKILKV